MAAERRDEMVRQERDDDQNRGSGPDHTGTDSANLDDLMESRTEIRDWLECPICLGIIKKARTVVECMHRFCGDCIEGVLEKGMNDCPICRRHIPSRTSLKDDANFDGLVEAVCKVVEKSGDKRKAPTDDEGEKQTKVGRIIGSPSNQTSGCGEETSDSELSKSANPIPNGQINNDEEHVHIPLERLDEETRQSMAEKIMENMVLPEVRTRVRELPIEEQDSICCNVYRSIVPYLEVLYLLEDKEDGDMRKEVEEHMERLNRVLHSTQEVIAFIIMCKARPGGWKKKWYKSADECERDLRDAAAVYYKIGKSDMKKIIRGAILQFCPSFDPSHFNLFNPSEAYEPPAEGEASLRAPPPPPDAAGPSAIC